MKTWMKVVIGGGCALGALLALPVIAVGSAFVGIRPMVDGQRVGPLTTVVDGYVSAFLGEAADGSLFLIDAGQDPAAEALFAALAARGRDPSHVRALFVTHGHGDHVGGCGAFPGATVYAVAAEAPIVDGRASAKGPLPRWASNDGTCAVDVTLADGQTVDVGGTSITAFAVPGHTAGSAVYRVNDVLVFGDAATAEADGDLRGAPWVFTDDVGEADASLVALAARVGPGVRWLAFAHSGPIEADAALRAFQPR